MDDRGDMIKIDPAARNTGADIRLVLMVGLQNLDWPTEHRAAEVMDGHFCCNHGPGAPYIRVVAGHVREHPDAHRLFGADRRGESKGHRKGERKCHGARVAPWP